MEDNENLGKLTTSYKTLIGYSGMGWIFFALGVFYTFCKEYETISDIEGALSNFFLGDILNMLVVMFGMMGVYLFVNFFFAIRASISYNIRLEAFGVCKRKAGNTFLGFAFSIAALFIIFISGYRLCLLFLGQNICYVTVCIIYFVFLGLHEGESCQRMSFNIFYPSILTVGLNFYIGLSIYWVINTEVDKGWIEQLIMMMPIGGYWLFLVATFIAELTILKKKDNQADAEKSVVKRRQKSTKRFMIIGAVVVFLYIVIALLGGNSGTKAIRFQSSRNMVFSIIMALYLSVFEGWDAIKEYSGEVLSRNIRHIDVAMLVYPCAFYLMFSIFATNFANTTIIILFSVHTFFAIRTWIDGNKGNAYSGTNWNKKKLEYGLAIIAIVIVSIAFPGNFVKMESSMVISGAEIAIGIGPFLLSRKYRDEKVANPRETITYDVYVDQNRKGMRDRLFSWAMLAYCVVLIIILTFGASYFNVNVLYQLQSIIAMGIMHVLFFVRAKKAGAAFDSE